MHHHLAAALSTVRDREPPRVVASGLRTPLHPALPLIHGEVALGVETALLLPRVLKRRSDPLAWDTLGRRPLRRGGYHRGQVLRQVGNVREPSEDLFGWGVYGLALFVLLGHGFLPSSPDRHGQCYPRGAVTMLSGSAGHKSIGDA